MKKLLNIFPNLRCDLLIMMWGIAALMLFCETEKILQLLAVKAVAVALIVVSAILYDRWSRQGLIDEMDDLICEED